MMRGQQEVRELASKLFDAEMGENDWSMEYSVAARAVVEEIAVAIWDAAFEAMRAMLWERNEKIAKEVQGLLKLVERKREGKIAAGPGQPGEGRRWGELKRGEQPEFYGGNWRRDDD